MSDVLLTQTATVIYRVHYTRADMVEMLSSIDGDRDLGALTNRELGQLMVDTANNTEGYPVDGMYEKMVEDADSPDETIDVGDWEVTTVYAESEVPTP